MTGDHLRVLAEAVRALLAVEAHGPGLWTRLEELGFTSLTVPERQGGSGGTLADAAVVVREAGAAAATGGVALPLAEALFIAGPLLAASGAALPPGTVTAYVGELVAEPAPGGRWTVTGPLTRVPWLRSADHLVALADTPDGPATAVLRAPERPSPGENLAGEERDSAVLDGAEAAVTPLPPGPWRQELELHGATARALQLAGAARAVLTLTTGHVAERVQFGRPLARFQAVQHRLARLAADVVTVEVMADAAVAALRHGDRDRELVVACAKAEASALARSVAAAGHQMHGAIGFTTEHRLGACTRRLWAWREEHGNELHWQRRCADLARRSGDVWELVTGGPPSAPF
ncbi:acyl-CoA dehydrogenase family protein [Nonomuraea sp. NPDC050153]|uniref:acyl-CoA dehydrogenase family protein n=1 Tax=Nonomuraea sp. NPDC050153 TaxID=3364359 RepID=UPI0037AA2FF1